MLDLITQKYPNTNYSGIMLDYYINKLNEVIRKVNELDDEVDKLPGYVKNAEIVNNSYLKVTFGNGNVINYALPSGNHTCIDLYNQDAETVNIYELAVNDIEHYDSNITNNRIFYDPLYAGIPTIIRYLPNGAGTGSALVVNIVASPNPSFTIWDEENDVWRAFTIGFSSDGVCQIKREY